MTLVLACVFAGAWSRGFSAHDTLTLHTSSRTCHYWRSDRDGLEWSMVRDHSDSVEIPPIAGFADRLSFHSAAYDPSLVFEPTNEVFLDFQRRRWRFDWFGIRFGPTGYGKLEVITVILPHSFVVIPLTLLSAWLLLSKPRVKKIEQTAQAPN